MQTYCDNSNPHENWPYCDFSSRNVDEMGLLRKLLLCRKRIHELYDFKIFWVEGAERNGILEIKLKVKRKLYTIS